MESFITLRATVIALNSGCQSWWHRSLRSLSRGAPRYFLSSAYSHVPCWPEQHSRQGQASWSVFTQCDTCPFTKKRKKETSLPVKRRGPGCARCWLSPGCPWRPHSSHSICARLGTAAPGQRESSAYSLSQHTLSRQKDTWRVYNLYTICAMSPSILYYTTLYSSALNLNILNVLKTHNPLINTFTCIFSSFIEI